MKWRFRMTDRWRRALVVLAVLVSTKAAWVWGCSRTSALGDADMFERRAQVLHRITSESYASDFAVTPGGVFGSEWRLVTLSMGTTAMVNVAFTHPETRAEALAACDKALEHALDPRTRAFEVHQWGSDPLEDLDGPHGHIGYLGHLAFMLGACRSIGLETQHAALHEQLVETITRRMAKSPSRHVATYPGEIYTADNSVGVAAVSLFHLVTNTPPRPVVREWVQYTRAHLLDADNELIVFRVTGDGRPAGKGRGSAAGYSSLYLPLIDTELAAHQRQRVAEHMLVDMPFGGRALREYARGVDGGSGDVDTGPLFFGVSPSATGFFLAGARHMQDDALTLSLLRTAEMAGFTGPCTGGRCYWLAPMVGDAIVLAARTATPWDRRYLEN